MKKESDYAERRPRSNIGTLYLDLVFQGIRIINPKKEERKDSKSIKLHEASFINLSKFFYEKDEKEEQLSLACVYDLIRDGGYKRIFSSLSKNMDLFCFDSYLQIKNFIKNSLMNFRPEKYKYHFLFKDKTGNYFVVYTGFSMLYGLFVSIYSVSDTVCFTSGNNNRFVFLQNKIKN